MLLMGPSALKRLIVAGISLGKTKWQSWDCYRALSASEFAPDTVDDVASVHETPTKVPTTFDRSNARGAIDQKYLNDAIGASNTSDAALLSNAQNQWPAFRFLPELRLR